MPRHRVVRSLACALRTSPTNVGVMRCVREPHVPPNLPRITRPLPLRRASPSAPLHICETRLLSSCIWLHPAAHPCTAMSKRCCGVASRTYSRSAGQCLGRLRKVLHSLSRRFPKSPVPRPSPQGTPEALPSPILRRLSRTSQRRAVVRFACTTSRTCSNLRTRSTPRAKESGAVGACACKSQERMCACSQGFPNTHGTTRPPYECTPSGG